MHSFIGTVMGANICGTGDFVEDNYFLMMDLKKKYFQLKVRFF